MSRDWFAVSCVLIRKPRFRGLSDAAQLTLIYAWAIAGDQTPEATWIDDAELEDSLALAGRTGDTIPELRARQWVETVDTDAGPRTRLAGWDVHQLAATQAARRDWQRTYMQEWRKKSPRTPLEDKTDTEHDMTALTTREPHVVNGWDSFGKEWGAFRDGWIRYGFKHAPSEKQREILWPIVRDWPREVAVWMSQADKGLDAYRLVDYVVRRYRARIAQVPPDEPPTRREDDGTAGMVHAQVVGRP